MSQYTREQMVCSRTTKENEMSRNEMFCRLDEAVITEDGDYIPKNMLVRVLGWSQEKEKLAEGLIQVEATAYMYPDYDDDDDFRSFIGTGMLIDVKPSALTFSSFDKGE
jgi:hypothetical protein